MPAVRTVGSLFTGIGGLDLGLERAGWTIIWQSEIESYCCKVLRKHWPDLPNLGDVKTIDWSTVERPDLICGGYPCQPFSFAGTRGGIDDPRHLWPYFADALRQLRPKWALLENVPGHLGLGFEQVQEDLAALGYDTEWESLPAAAFGAPHLRWRIFLVAHAEGTDGEACRAWGVAHTNGGRLKIREELDGEPQQDTSDRNPPREYPHRLCDDVADTDRPSGRSAWRSGQEVLGPGSLKRPGRRGGSSGDHWAVEPDVGRVAHGVPARVDRLRGLGNAVVPQVAEWIGRQIMEASLKSWQLKYQAEQTALDCPDSPATVPKRSLAPCGVLAPETGVKLCLKPFQGADSFCQRIAGHDGGHSGKPSACNRPAGHEGPHTFVTVRAHQGVRKLGEW